jgi:hypothetical protein
VKEFTGKLEAKSRWLTNLVSQAQSETEQELVGFKRQLQTITSDLQEKLEQVKHTYEYLPYNHWPNTRLAKDVLCNTICYMTTNDNVRNVQLKSFKLITHI